MSRLYRNGGPSKLLAELRRAYPGSRSTHDLIDALYADREDGGPENAAKQVTKGIRRLRVVGYPIASKPHSGYRLEKIEAAG